MKKLTVMRGLLSVVLAVSLANVIGSVGAKELGFTDTADHWASAAISTAVQKGYVDGYEDNTFRPDVGVTRAEYIKMVVTAQKHPVPKSSADKPWYEPYYNVALQKGLITGTDFSLEKLNMPIARVEMAKISVRAANSKWQKEEMVDGEALYESTKVGLIQGMDDQGALAPMAQTTRAQSVTVIERILTLNDRKELPVDEYATSNAEIEWHRTNVFTMLPQYFLRGYMDSGKNIDISKFRYEGENGFSEVEKFVVIDLDDPNDPNLDLIKDRKMAWRFNKSGQRLEGIGEWPKNAYALISVNRLVVDSPNAVSVFRTGGVYINYNGESEVLRKEGKPWGVGGFSEYHSKYQALYSASVFDVQQGHNDMRYIYGQFLPKGKLVSPNGVDYVNLYVHSASDLGQPNSPHVYTSKVDYSLARE